MKKGLKILFSISIIVNVLFVSAVVVAKAKGINYATNIIREITATIINKKKVIFLGDSVTEQTNWDDLFKKSVVVNTAIGGNYTYKLLHDLDSISFNHTDKVFLMIGVNDLGRGENLDEIMRNYKSIVNRLIHMPSQFQLVIQSVLPINESMKETNFPDYKASNENIIKLNKFLVELCEKEKLTYVDIHSHMIIANKQLNPNFTVDGVHLNKNGYQIWKKILAKE